MATRKRSPEARARRQAKLVAKAYERRESTVQERMHNERITVPGWKLGSWATVTSKNKLRQGVKERGPRVSETTHSRVRLGFTDPNWDWQAWLTA